MATRLSQTWLRRCCRIIALVLWFCAPLSLADGFEWKSDTSGNRGMDAGKLQRLCDRLAALNTHAFLVIRQDRIVFEWYGKDSGPDKPHGTASLAKALVGGMSLAAAMQDGRLTPDDFASRYIPAWKIDAKKSKITIGQLAMHSSGLDDATEPGVPHEKLTGWKGDFWKRDPDPFTISRDRVPVRYEPGSRVSYSNPGMAMLAYAVTAAIQPGDQKDLRSLLGERIYGPIGIGPKEWSIGYGKMYRVNGLDLEANWGGAAFTARAAARIGRLMLHEGDWDGKRILDARIVRACIDPPDAPKPEKWEGDCSPRPGFGWWTNRDGSWASTPRDAYLGAGAGQQLLIVIPSLDLIAVRNGQAFGAPETNWVQVEKHLLAPLVEAVVDAR